MPYGERSWKGRRFPLHDGHEVSKSTQHTHERYRPDSLGRGRLCFVVHSLPVLEHGPQFSGLSDQAFSLFILLARPQARLLHFPPPNFDGDLLWDTLWAISQTVHSELLSHGHLRILTGVNLRRFLTWALLLFRGTSDGHEIFSTKLRTP